MGGSLHNSEEWECKKALAQEEQEKYGRCRRKVEPSMMKCRNNVTTNS